MMKKLYWFLIFNLFAQIYATGQNFDIQKLNDFFTQVEDMNLAGGTVCIQYNGKSLYDKNFGQQNLPASTVDNLPLRYRIGSISKMFTAVMIYQQIEKRTISPDETIATYFPDVPNAHKITVSHLLGHTSGLKDYSAKKDSIIVWLMKPVSEAEIMNEIIAQGVDFEPGDNLSYSNSGYYLLSRLLEKKLSKPYRDILTQNIVNPLSLHHTEAEIVKNKSIVKPYGLNTLGKWHEIDDFYFPNVSGLGDLVSTPQDLCNVIEGMFYNKLISTESLNSMKPEGTTRFGKGLMRYPFHDKTFYGHGGNTMGYHSVVIFNPDDSLTIAMSLNAQTIVVNDVLTGVLSAIYNKPYNLPDVAAPGVYTINPDLLDNYVGVFYNEEYELKFEIKKENNNLLLQMENQPSGILEAFGKDSFRNLTAKFEINFNPDTNTANLLQHGHNFVFSKLDEKRE